MVTSGEIEVRTRGRDFIDVTGDIARMVQAGGVVRGICAVSILHTSASLIVCENADRTVQDDLNRFMERLVPDGDPLFRHDAEGGDDMPAHVRSVLTHTDVTVPVHDGGLVLGTWQGIYLWEHRRRPHLRRVRVTIVGDG